MPKKLNILFGFLFVLLIVILIVNSRIIKSKLEQYHKYTIGYYKESFFSGRSRQYIKYYFILDNNRYDGEASFPSDPVIPLEKGQPVLIMYYPPNPKINTVIFGYPVPDSIYVIPKEGWDTIPFKRKGEIYFQ